MNSAHALIIAVSLVFFSAQAISAQDLSRYRAYALESSVDVVVAATGARPTEAQTIHERPAKIQELQWRAPYVSQGSSTPDPVRSVAFTFFNDELYQVFVTYDRDRTEGLTAADIIESLTASYGAPVLKSAIARTGLPAATLLDATVLAQWDSDASSVTLLRGTYSPDFQLILSSKSLSARARTAIREAIRLDAVEAPRREVEERKKEVADASAARDKARSTNKAAFRP
jgi:hypothetical protein